MNNYPYHVVYSESAFDEFDRTFASRPASFHLVADAHTWQVSGAAVWDRCVRLDPGARKTVFDDGHLVASDLTLARLDPQLDDPRRTLVAVGSGTITDLVRFAATQRKMSYVLFPTAPSVDAYTSENAAMIMNGAKQTFPARAAHAIFIDPRVITSAPAEMLAAGFGDILGKYTALADWSLGRLLWQEPYDRQVAENARSALERCVAVVDGIARREPIAIQTLMESLLASGRSMAQVGSSRPASGSEHHIAHFCEMRQIQAGRQPVLHGLKVGLACALSAGLYASLRNLTLTEVKDRLEHAAYPIRPEWMDTLRVELGPAAPALLADQMPYLTLNSEQWQGLRNQIVDAWDEIQAVARLVPSAETIQALLVRAGGPADFSSAQVPAEDVRAALRYAQYLRNRFTILRLADLIGLD